MRSSTVPHILFIDNYSDSSRLIDLLLYKKKCNYNFSIANTPSEALELINSRQFDLFIVEYKLPEMNGIELCRQIRQTDKQTPILFFTKSSRLFEREISIAAGATDFLLKSSNFEQTADTIKRLLDNKIIYAQPSGAAAAHSINRINNQHIRG